MKDYASESYLAWYRRPTPTWLELSLAARGALASIAMELHYQTGELHLRRGLASLATLLRCEWSSLEPALDELLAVGKLAWDAEQRILRDPEYAERSRVAPLTGAERTALWRQRKTEQPRHDGDACDVGDETRHRDVKRKEENRREDLNPPLASLAPPVGGSEPVTGVRQVSTETETKPTRARGTRLPEDWMPSAEVQAWAKTQGIADPLGPLEEFRDFWRGVPGARGVKLDWDATYRNRLRQLGSRPASRARVSAAEATRQPFDPDAPWMKLPEVS